MSLIGLKPWIIPPVAYILYQICCPLSKHSELDLFMCLYITNWSLNSLVSKATCYSVEGLGFKPQWGRDISQPSRPALRLTQSPLQWVSLLSPRGKVVPVWC